MFHLACKCGHGFVVCFGEFLDAFSFQLVGCGGEVDAEFIQPVEKLGGAGGVLFQERLGVAMVAEGIEGLDRQGVDCLGAMRASAYFTSL